ncbi:MAG TPA: hypothetical protein VHL11_24865 [Phototrophicaceae bacterium]|jgi:hypothetical protein|nr:hypothetical protein [Phototrophicaceae bacterium]
MIKRFRGKSKFPLIVFSSIIFVVLLVNVAYDAYNNKLPQKLFPRPTLPPEMLEDYWKNPRPLPKPMGDVPTRTRNGASFCIYIFPSELWTSGDEGGDIYASVQRSFELYIDGIYRDPRYIAEEATSMQLGEDGSYGGTISACYEPKNLSIGLHSAEIQFSDTHGGMYFYAWVFEVSS